MLRRALGLGLVVTSLLAGSFFVPRALAQRRVTDPIEAGIALREQGRDEEALALFSRAYDETGSPRALAQMALAEQALERFVEAEAHLGDALTRGDDAFIRRNREALDGALAEIRRRLGDLSVTGGVPGAEILIAGVAVGVLPLDAPLRVVAGSVAIEIRADGHERYVNTVVVRGGGSATVDVELVRDASAAPPPERDPVETQDPEPTPDAPSNSPPWALPVGIALAGAGVLGVVIGSGLMVVREDNAHVRETCSDTEPACRSAYQSAVDAEAGGIASFVLGGALIAGGTTVLALSMTGALGASGPPGEEETAVVCAPGLLSMSCAGRF